MKKLFSLLSMLSISMAVFSQSSLLATLSHEGDISIFHGSSALGDALAAAEHGDIITLSSGRYDAVDIDKAITLRGAGMEEDAAKGIQPTRIVGDFTISVSEDVASGLSVEGIYNTEKITIVGIPNNTIFQKCSFYEIGCDISDSHPLTIIHCKINGSIVFNSDSSGSLINSYIRYVRNDTRALELTNCYVSDPIDVNNSVFTNCILLSSWNGYFPLSESNMCYNCVGLGSVLSKVSQSTNTSLKQEKFNAMFKENTFYELTDEAKTIYLGNDGTEVGLYGGNLPYSTHILSPQITKCNVAAKTTADGKLSVDIEVKAAE